MDAIAKALDVPYRPKPGGAQVKFNLQDADLGELVNHISGLTGKRFIYGQKVRQIKVTVVSPTPVSIDEAYEAFLSILQSNGMTVVPHGRFLKIVDTGGIVAETTPIYDRGEPIPDTDRFVTRLYRLRSTSATEASNLLGKFKSKEGDISVYEPGSLLILTDRGSNIERMVRILEEIDVGGAGSSMWIEPIHYGSAADMAKQFNEIFELNQPGGSKGAPGLMKVIADDKTNSLVIVGTEDSYLKLLELLKRVDIAPAASGRIRVLPLQHAMAEELAATMTQMLTSAKATSNANQPGAPAPVFEGEVRVVADKPTNSLVVTSSARDYAQIRVVVDQLDHARRQVFIDAVIMDVSVERTMNLGLAFHGGATADLGGPSDTVLLGGLDPLKSVAPTDPTQLQGLALGVRGPDLAEQPEHVPGLSGLSIPAFGVVLNAIATSGDSNFLSTPHIIATDNTPAEINIGENIALQQNVGGLRRHTRRSRCDRGAARSARSARRSRGARRSRRRGSTSRRRDAHQGDAAHQRHRPGSPRDPGRDQRSRRALRCARGGPHHPAPREHDRHRRRPADRRHRRLDAGHHHEDPRTRSRCSAICRCSGSSSARRRTTRRRRIFF